MQFYDVVKGGVLSFWCSMILSGQMQTSRGAALKVHYELLELGIILPALASWQNSSSLVESQLYLIKVKTFRESSSRITPQSQK